MAPKSTSSTFSRTRLYWFFTASDAASYFSFTTVSLRPLSLSEAAARVRRVQSPAMRIRLEHVTHAYAGSAESAAVQVLDDVSLNIAYGDFAVLMGASGSGKSTLLNLIGAVDKPTSGSMFLDDVDTS